MSQWSSSIPNNHSTPQSKQYSVPGSYPVNNTYHQHSASNSSLQETPKGKHYYRNLQNGNNSSPRSIHIRSDSDTYQSNTPSQLLRSTSRKRAQTTDYLKLIPPAPSTPPQYQQNRNRGISSPSTGSTKDTNTNSNSANFTPPTSVLTANLSTCATCQKPITTKSVKALGKRYHTHCFGCADCGTPILSKYFPFETDSGIKLPLCEEHFYKRRGLICCVCNSYLKGTHYTVFGRKYDAEHFCCKICSKKFETDEDFFNHEDNIYCHYHFSKFFIERCEGCEFSILKQYIEIFRGGKNQKWHVECYMIHKCWNVSISPNTIGIASFPKIEPTEQNIKGLPDTNPTPEELLTMESKASDKIGEIWNTLFKFEEDTATCISDMLQFATSNDQLRGLESTCKLVFKIDALFKSIDYLHRLGIDPNFAGILSFQSTSLEDNPENFQTLKKEPRNLSAKIMIYLAILRKTGKENQAINGNQDLILSVVTGLAHYLKLLIRYGLNNSLHYNQKSHTTATLDRFLREIRNHENVSDDPLSSLDIPIDSSDLCFHCQKSIESECAQYQDKRWHIQCLYCINCRKNLPAYSGVADATFNSKNNWVLCAQCAVDDPDARPGFKLVSKLLQLSYLLKIAVVRSKAVMDYEVANGSIEKGKSNKAGISQDESDQTYMKTLNDIKRLRSTRQNTKISNNTSTRENARRSVIIETTDSSKDNDFGSKYLSDEFIARQKITVEDEPLGSTTLSKQSFNRATNFINSQKVLTLDDIPRIVAAEHARELRPNTYKYHNPHQEESLPKEVKSKSNSLSRRAPSIQASVLENSNQLKKDTRYYSQLTDHERFVITHISAALLRRFFDKNKIGSNIDVTKFLDLKKTPTFWEKLKGIGNNEKKSYALNKVFGSDLKDLVYKTGVESSQSNGPSKVRVPMVIDDLLTALYQKDMSTEGVFRKNGNLKTLKELTLKIDSNPTKVPNLTEENAIQLSALLKKFLREMPNPLLSFRLYDLWILSQKVGDPHKRVIIELSYSLLPKAHRDLAEVLLFFFMWASSFSHLDEQSGSKMDIHNLATVLSPNILYAKPSEVTRPSNNKAVAATYYDAFGENEGENYYLAIEVIDYLITHNEELSMVPSYLIDLYESCKFEKIDQLTSKEIFNKIEQVLKENPEFLAKIEQEDSNHRNRVNEPSIFEETHQQPLETTYERV